MPSPKLLACLFAASGLFAHEDPATVPVDWNQHEYFAGLTSNGHARGIELGFWDGSEIGPVRISAEALEFDGQQKIGVRGHIECVGENRAFCFGGPCLSLASGTGLGAGWRQGFGVHASHEASFLVYGQATLGTKDSTMEAGAEACVRFGKAFRSRR